MVTKISMNAPLTQNVKKDDVERVKSAYEKLKMAVVVASLLTLRFYNTRNGVRMAIVRSYIPNTRSFREFKLPLNQELFDALISIWFGQEPKEITSFDIAGWEAETEENLSFEVFKLLNEAGVRMIAEEDKVKEGEVVGVPFKVKNGGKFVIDLYLPLNEEVENYLKANNLR